MAYTSGTATDYLDLLSILATFAAANGWTIKEQSSTVLFLEGSGDGGLDEIHVGIEAFENTTSGYYNWKMCGAWAYRPGRAVGSQPMSSGDSYLYLWDQSIPYWMVATPRRIIIVAKVTTTFQMAHLGLLDPVGTELQYPYPLLVGGCGNTAAQVYSATGDINRAFWANGSGTTGYLSVPGGIWEKVDNGEDIFVYSQSYEDRGNIIRGIDGTYLLEQLYCCSRNRVGTFGAFDGLLRISGYENSAENIITVGATNYLVVQDVYRTAVQDYCALRLN